MKSVSVLILILLLHAGLLHAQKFIPTDKGSRIEFSVKTGKGTDAKLLKGLLSGLTGTITFDQNQPEKSAFDVSVSTLGIRTSSNLATEKITMAEYLNSRLFPTIRVKSTSVSNNGGPVFEIEGVLTIKGVSKPIKIQFTVQNTNGTPSFRGLLRFNRNTFKVGSSQEMDDVVSVYLNIKTKRA